MNVVAQALYGAPGSMTPKSQSFNVSFILGSRLLANTIWPLQYSHEVAHTPYSIALCCPACGDIWGRILVHENPEQWLFSIRRCRQHTKSLSLLQGGVFSSINLQENFDIPKAVLVEDFLFLMTFVENSPDVTFRNFRPLTTAQGNTQMSKSNSEIAEDLTSARDKLDEVIDRLEESDDVEFENLETLSQPIVEAVDKIHEATEPSDDEG